MDETKKLIPKRRFKEFQNSEAWEQRKLGEMATISTGYPFNSNEFDEKGNYLVITNGNIQNDSPTVNGHIGNRIKIENYDSRYEYILKRNDILVTMDGTVGRTAKVIESQQVLAQRVGRLTVKADPEFVYQFLNTGAFFDEMTLVSHGGTIKHISLNEIGNYENFVPYNNEEVKKIGKFFGNLDNLITLHQRKLDKIKSTKKAYLYEMFPAEGESKPKRRFKGFTDDWKQCEFKDVSDIVRGASPRPIKDTKWFDERSEVGWLRISDVTEQNGRIKFLEQRISDAGQKKTRVLYEPHLLLSIAATVGKPVINYVKTGVHDGFLIFLNPKFNQEFMFQWFEMFRPKWQQFGQPGSQVNLNSELVKNTTIMLPKEDEQTQIADFLKSIDNLITLHQHKLDKLKNLKKSYLNEMFI